MRRLAAARAPAGRAAAADRRRRDGEWRGRGRPGRRAARGGGRSTAVAILATDISRGRPGAGRENAVGHAVADQMPFARRDLLPPAGRATVRPRPRQPAVRPQRRHRRAAGRGLVRAALALDGGPDGLAVIGRLARAAARGAGDGGVALLEIGADQGEAIVGARRRPPAGLACAVEPDLAGLPRVARVERVARRRRATHRAAPSRHHRPCPAVDSAADPARSA